MIAWFELEAHVIKALAARLEDPKPGSPGGPPAGTDISSVLINKNGFLFVHDSDAAEADFWPTEDLMEVYG